MSKKHEAGVKKVRSGFTLIELLVVVSIIALLVSILMPALGRARDQAKTVKCAAQMRQYAVGVYMYATDNGHIPWYGWAWDPSNGNIPNKDIWEKEQSSYWYNAINTYMQAAQGVDYDATGGKIRDTFQELRHCPAAKKGGEELPSGVYKSNDVWIGVNYGTWPYAPFTYEYQGSVDNLGKRNREVRLTSIRHPAAWLMLLDTDQNLVYSPDQWKLNLDGDGDGTIDTYYATGRLYSGAQPRVHNDGMNVGLCDGHVEWVRYKDIWQWDTTKSQMVHQYWKQ